MRSPDRLSNVRAGSLQVEDVLDAVRNAAEATGIETYLVGGFVRDRLMGHGGKDIDLVTVGSDGIPVLEHVARELGWSRPQTFERFGTGQIRGDDFIVEVVRARAERYDPESRKPDVRPGTLEDDVRRRDFTVNALCQTLDGRIIDITGQGIADLRRGVLRTPLPPRETFSEDPLRMLRAARFTAQLGFRVVDGIVDAIRQEAPRITIVSVERITDELRRLMTAAHPSHGFALLRNGGLLRLILPEVEAMIGVEQGGYHIHDVYDHTMHALDAAPRDLITRAGVLFHDVGKPPTHALSADGRHTFYEHAQVGAAITRDVLTRLRFSNDEVDAVAQLVKLHLRPIQYEETSFSDTAVRRLIRDAGDLRHRMLDVARADTNASSFPSTAGIDELETRMALLDAGGQVSHLRDPLTGDEIMSMAGRGPGPWVGKVKQAIRDAVLDGDIAAGDADAARAWLRARPELLQPE
jgi:putative nucleotidyltransferase with HDIG domain